MAPNFLLKIIPHVDDSPRICELVEYHLKRVLLKGAWTGPAALSLTPYALASVAELPVLEVVPSHIVADLTLGLGKVVHDYLREPGRRSLRNKQEHLIINHGYDGAPSRTEGMPRGRLITSMMLLD